MSAVNQAIRFLSTLFGGVLLAVLLAAATSQSAFASDVRFIGETAYTYLGNTATMTAAEIANISPSGFSGTLRLELWALAGPYTGGGVSGYKLAEYQLGQLTAGTHYASVATGDIPFATPPNGTYTIVMLVTEYVAGPVDDGFSPDDYVNFSGTVTFGPVGPPPPALTPQIGLWWNPNESGTGYAIDYKHGTLVMTVYSYTASGAPQWYLAFGPLSGDTWTGTLYKFTNGQCISCAYKPEVDDGSNDGTVTVVFSSPTSGTMYLPGGRVTQIQPQAF